MQMHISIQITEHMTFIKQYLEIFTYRHLRSKYYTVPLTFHIETNQLQSISISCIISKHFQSYLLKEPEKVNGFCNKSEQGSLTNHLSTKDSDADKNIFDILAENMAIA